MWIDCETDGDYEPLCIPQQGRLDQSQVQQDDYDQQNFATSVITVSRRTSYPRGNDDYGSSSWRNSGTASSG